MDFTGGPWLLRNGERVDSLVKAAKHCMVNGIDFFTDGNRIWDANGNHFSPILMDQQYDIMESLHNWKYLRGHE